MKASTKRKHVLGEYEQLDYPGDFTDRMDGESYVRKRKEDTQSKFERTEGVTNARALAAGKATAENAEHAKNSDVF